MQNVLIMTVGLPRSGKSTWSRHQEIPVVNPDSIRLAIHGQDYRKESEPLVWAVAHTMVESLFIAGHTRVILDATNGVKSRRSEWKNPLWVRKYRVFGTPAEECLRRAVACGKDYLCQVIGRMNAEWEPIDEDDLDNLQEDSYPS